MSATPNVIQSTINYYAFHGYYNHIVSLCEKILKLGKDPVIVFWHSYGHVMQGNLSEAIRGFSSIKQRKEIELASYIGLLYAHNQTSNTDEEEVQQLAAMIEIGVDDAPDSAKLQAALFYLHTSQYTDAKDLLDKIDDTFTDKYSSVASVKGWVNLKDEDITSQDPGPIFDEAIKKSPFQGRKDLDALMGRAQAFEKKKQFEDAIKLLNSVVVDFSQFLPAYLTKARLLIAIEEWEQADKALQKILTEVDQENIEALTYRILYLLTKEYNFEYLIKLFQTLYRSLKNSEPRNDKLFAQVASIFGSLTDHEQILEICIDLIEIAKKLSPRKGSYYTIHGNLLNQAKRYKSAEEVFNKAIDILNSDSDNMLNDANDNIPANKGLIKALIGQNKIDEAIQFITFLNDLSDSFESGMDEHDTTEQKPITSDLKLLNALVQSSLNSSEECLDYLQEATRAHDEEIKGLHSSLEFFARFNLTLLLDIAQQYQEYSPSEPLSSTDPPSQPLQRSTAVLEKIIRYIPSSLKAELLYAKNKYLSRDFDTAQTVINECLKKDNTLVQAHILLAEISYAQENYTEASTALERAISSNFQIRDWPIFNLLRAKVSAATGDSRGALDVLQRALKIVENPSAKLKVSNQEIVSVYLELANVYSLLSQEYDASRVIEEALEKFKDNPDCRDQILIANAKIHVKKNEVETALGILGSISPHSKHHLKAKGEMAYIYLNKRQDKSAYLKSFEELVENNPESANNWLSLGDAYSSVQDPTKAIESYDKALKLGDSHLASEILQKIASAHLKTHNFLQALNHYQKALKKDQNKITLRLELCELLFKLKRFQEAAEYLKQGIDSLEQNPNELSSMMNQVVALQLSAKVNINTNNLQEAIVDLLKARNLQNKVLQRVKSGQKETILLQKAVAASICSNLGDLHSVSDKDKAVSFYTEAIENDESNEKSLLALAEISMKNNDFEECQNLCLSLLRISPSQERAAMLLADIMFRKSNFTEAIEHFSKLLEQKPGNFAALAQLIKLLRRAGKLDQLQPFMDRAKESSSRAYTDPGYHFCCGLQHYYCNSPRDALKELNYARKSREWGQQAILHMIDIYLQNSSIDSNIDSIEARVVTPEITENTDAAQKLLNELATAPVDELNSNLYVPESKKKVIEGQIMVAKAKTKSDVEKALPLFLQVFTKDKDNVAALVAMANALLLIKQTSKARNNLKHVLKLDNTSEEDADEFEKGWLLLANMYIGMSKNEEAEDVIGKILKLNKSCSKAWELKGLIHEKSKAYKESAECYEYAWRLTSEKDPAIGFKLASNYLKARRNLEAIEICHKVLSAHPRYPRIRKEILDIARIGLRP